MCAILGYIGKKIKVNQLINSLKLVESRGPDNFNYIIKDDLFLGFNRLSIMDLSDNGLQPFKLIENYSICNGELYGFSKQKKQLIKDGYKFNSNSDCEILLPLFDKYGYKFVNHLDAEAAFVIYDSKNNELIAGRDPIGIRPLFYGFDEDNKIIFASEAKMLACLVDKIYPFPPGYIYYNNEFHKYSNLLKVNKYSNDDLETVCKNIKNKLDNAVEKRLNSDAKVGFLLSGGLDSSLVCAIAKDILKQPITTFSIGFNEGAVDLKYARIVADYLGSKHYEFTFTFDDVLSCLDELIYSLATYDITTIRASLGMFLLCKKIRENTDIKVILTGEISDELFGYKYTDFAPDAKSFQRESIKRIRELHYYDVLRADRCISANSLEARVPFGDLDFVKYVLSINPQLKLNTYDMGKYLLRHAYENANILPRNILFREKEAFSDGVGHKMVDLLKEYADNKYSDEEYEILKKKYDKPFPIISKESLLYRQIFEKHYKNNFHLIPQYWMPNKKWNNCNVNDPSARVLQNYGKSGE